MISPDSICIDSLPSVLLSERSNLPAEPCIYFAIDAQGVVQYIGRSVNPKARWTAHHRYEELAFIEGVRIAYLSMDADLLHGVELALINWFKPALNISGQNVCKYSAPQTIGELIASRRVAMGLTQDELARRLLVTGSTLRNWESDRFCPRLRPRAMGHMAAVLGVTVGDLVEADSVK